MSAVEARVRSSNHIFMFILTCVKHLHFFEKRNSLQVCLFSRNSCTIFIYDVPPNGIIATLIYDLKSNNL